MKSLKNHLMKPLIISVFLLTLIIAGGCAGRSGSMASFVTKTYPADQAVHLADRMADSLVEIFPPGHTSVFLNMATEPDDFGPAFDSALRSRGFVIVSEPSDQALTLSYTLDQVDELTWYTRLSVSGGLVITRTYVLIDGQLAEGAATRMAGGDHGQR